NIIKAQVQNQTLSLRESTIFWPDKNERRAISHQIELQYGFPNCVGITNGCLFNLANKPLRYGEDYFHRKCSSHDQRVLNNTKLFQNCKIASFAFGVPATKIQ
ncbi:hypothetical protein BJ741DRAFT_565643, partial [Chytriomyces cf. hyalinus JEL632]